MPTVGGHQRTLCCRCRTEVKHLNNRNPWAAMLALSAMLLYPPAMLLPMLKLTRLGYVSDNSLVSGTISLLAEGFWVIGGIVLLFSIILPPFKLAALWALAHTDRRDDRRYRSAVYHFVELVGRWSMLDVMLVAILVAYVKLGDLVEIHPGPGVVAFAAMVLLSLFASLIFNPHAMWDESMAPS